jgi:hypothetical protein
MPQRFSSVVLLTLSLSSGFAQTVSEYEVKAVFVFNFLQFIAWPETAFESPASPFVIGIVGKNGLGTHLEQVTSGERYNNHPVVVRYYDDATHLGECHLIFIASGYHGRKSILDHVSKKSILTVGDHADFLKEGGMIRFFTEKSKIRIEVNKDSIEKNNLTISSKLLRVATVYKK